VSIDADAYRAAMSQLATGVTVVSATGDDRHELMTANAVTSVSLQPALVMVAAAHEARWLAAVRRGGRFAVNVLAREHEPLARWCADRARHAAPDRIDGYDVGVSDTGVLTFVDALAVLECRLYDEHVAGDHTLVIGAVERASRRRPGPAPLVFFNREFTTVPDRPARLRSVAVS